MIVTILGARPQFVKAAALSKVLSDSGLREIIIHTGQHYDSKMSDIFFSELGIPGVHKNLNIGSGNHGKQTGEMLAQIEAELTSLGNEVKAVLVYGDTNSTLAGALCAAKLQIKVIHVEAGLRSFNRQMPEEINRVVTDHLADLLFCSSQLGIENLKNEGISKNVFDTGDIMYDSVKTFLPFAKKPTDKTISEIFEYPFNLITLHRPSNTDDVIKLQEILDSIGETVTPAVWPVHPRNRVNLNKLLIPKNINVIDPLSYFEMLYALHKCNRVFTDSGGLQKEAYWLKKPCITIRPQTEWVETLHNDWNQLCSGKKDDILKCYSLTPTLNSWYPLYGNGDTAQQITKIIRANI